MVELRRAGRSYDYVLASQSIESTIRIVIGDTGDTV